MNKGFIAVHRKLLDKSWYHKSNYAHVWLTLLLLATHKKREVWFAGKNIMLEPGQLITGRKKLKEITNIPETTLERILDHFEKNEHQIGQQKSNKNRLITIINWSEYQVIGQQSGQQADNKRTTSGQQADTNNNEDNVNNDDNEYKHKSKKFEIPPIEIVIMYFQERGLNGDRGKHEGEKFHDFYTSKNWYVGKNKMKDWKAAVRNWIRGIDEKQKQGIKPIHTAHPGQDEHKLNVD